jgi:S1-C subfamily serine protease
VQLRPLVPRIKAALGYDGTGALVEQVQPDTPADLAGVRAGDILTMVDDHAITTPGDLAFALAQGGAELRLTVWRENQSLTLVVSRVSTPSDITPATPQQVQRRDQYKLTDMGLILDADGTIRAVVNQGAGFFAGLTGGDRIVAINGTAIADLPDGWTRNYTFDSAVLLRISLPDGATRHYLLDPWEDGPALRLASGANVLDKEVVSFD